MAGAIEARKIGVWRHSVFRCQATLHGNNRCLQLPKCNALVSASPALSQHSIAQELRPLESNLNAAAKQNRLPRFVAVLCAPELSW